MNLYSLQQLGFITNNYIWRLSIIRFFVMILDTQCSEIFCAIYRSKGISQLVYALLRLIMNKKHALSYYTIHDFMFEIRWFKETVLLPMWSEEWYKTFIDTKIVWQWQWSITNIASQIPMNSMVSGLQISRYSLTKQTKTH